VHPSAPKLDVVTEALLGPNTPADPLTSFDDHNAKPALRQLASSN
jgi:hypothetical protein